MIKLHDLASTGQKNPILALPSLYYHGVSAIYDDLINILLLQPTTQKASPPSCCTRPWAPAAPSSSCSSAWPSSCSGASPTETSSSSKIRERIGRTISSPTWQDPQPGKSWIHLRRISGSATISSSWKASTSTRRWTRRWPGRRRRTIGRRRRWTGPGTTACWPTPVSTTSTDARRQSQNQSLARWRKFTLRYNYF